MILIVPLCAGLVVALEATLHVTVPRSTPALLHVAVQKLPERLMSIVDEFDVPLML